MMFQLVPVSCGNRPRKTTTSVKQEKRLLDIDNAYILAVLQNKTKSDKTQGFKVELVFLTLYSNNISSKCSGPKGSASKCSTYDQGHLKRGL